MNVLLDLLAAFTTIDTEKKDVRTNEQLHSFEVVRGILLPSQYKNFCQVIGSGVFGYYLTIYCPEVEQVEVDYLKDELRDSTGVEGSEFGYMLRERETLDDISLIQEILNAAFIFGRTSGGEIFFWDLRTYNQPDDNYDIYITRVEDFPGIYKIGRSFFGFLQAFALRVKPYSHLPEWTHPSLQELNGTFTPIKVPY